MRKISTAVLHAPFFFAGLGNMDKTLALSTCPGIEMWLTSDGLECTYKKVNFLIPLPNIVGCILAKTEPTKPAAVKAAS